MSKLKAAVFASGAGSNFQAIIETRALACEIVLLVCDKQNAGVIEIARKHQIPTFIFNAKEFASKQAYEEEIVAELRKREVSWIFLAGYMRIVGSTLLQAFPGKIINIHPSLLPNFPGKDAIGQAFQAGVETTGVTVHYIDEGIDTGPIIAQQSVAIFSGDTEETLKKKIQEAEHQLYPTVINQLLHTK